MPFIATAIIGSAVVGGIANLVAGSNAAGAATTAAQTQSDASKYAANVQAGIYNTTRNDLSPYNRAGQAGISVLSGLVPGGLKLPPGAASPLAGNPAGGQGTQAGAGGASGGGVTIDQDGNVVPTPTSGAGAGTPGSTQDFQIDPSTGQSPFLTSLLDKINPANANTTQLNSLVQAGPTKVDPDMWNAIKAFVPGSGVKGSPLLGAVLGMIPGIAQNNPGSGVTEDPVLTQLNALLGTGPAGSDPAGIQKALEATPGYQFTLDQGLKSTQNSFAAKGLGNSGAALKGAAQFSTGLANNTYEARLGDYLNTYNSRFANNLNAYNSTFNNTLNSANTDFTNRFNANNSAISNTMNTVNSQFTNSYNAYGQQAGIAQNLINTGENAGAQTGAIGANTGTSIGNNITGGAAATAAGIVGSANASGNALINTAGALGNAAVTNALFSNPATANALTGKSNSPAATGIYDQPPA